MIHAQKFVRIWKSKMQVETPADLKKKKEIPV